MNDAPSGPPDERDDALSQQLLSYLREHPRAMDSLEGIAEWWLARHQVRVEVERVAWALAKLAEQNVLERLTDEERVWYRLCEPDPPGRS